MTAKQAIGYLKYAAKSVWAFLSGVATNIAILWVVEKQPIPETRPEWLTLLGTSVAAAVLVYRQTNGPKPQPRRRRRKRKTPVPPPAGPTHDPQRRPVL
jgi:hypothetical protein